MGVATDTSAANKAVYLKFLEPFDIPYVLLQLGYDLFEEVEKKAA
jgi:hypothetical protein